LRTKLNIDGREYDAEISRKVSLPPDAPRLIVVSRQQNTSAMQVMRTCVEATQYFTPEPHELWVVDNNSPRENLKWLEEWPNINVVLLRTEPLPPEARGAEPTAAGDSQLTHDSYANAIGLEAGIQLIDPDTKYVMSMHMDTMPVRKGWLTYLRSKITGKIAAAGVRMDRTRTPDGVLHVLGYLVDFQLFRKLKIDYYPSLPELDVGDRVTHKLRQEGYDVFACPNTLWEPELVERIPEDSPFKDFHVDRAFDDQWNVIFLHLGRGVRKSIGEHRRGTAVEEWVALAHKHLIV
jgi:hypothetical protein